MHAEVESVNTGEERERGEERGGEEGVVKGERRERERHKDSG